MPKTRRGWDPNQQKRRLKLCTSHREIDLAITIRGVPRLVCGYWFPPILWFKLIRNLWHILFRSHRKLDWFLYGKERWFEILDAHHSLTVNMSVDVGARLSLWKYIEILNHPLSLNYTLCMRPPLWTLYGQPCCSFSSHFSIFLFYIDFCNNQRNTEHTVR